ncbi:hypothetical protein [Dyella sp.]|uniref:hypothetical protein n=1 Tax=Dyella sp. TaxID=1869338 RepID=UPI002ED22935
MNPLPPHNAPSQDDTWHDLLDVYHRQAREAPSLSADQRVLYAARVHARWRRMAANATWLGAAVAAMALLWLGLNHSSSMPADPAHPSERAGFSDGAIRDQMMSMTIVPPTALGHATAADELPHTPTHP